MLVFEDQCGSGIFEFHENNNTIIKLFIMVFISEEEINSQIRSQKTKLVNRIVCQIR